MGCIQTDGYRNEWDEVGEMYRRTEPADVSVGDSIRWTSVVFGAAAFVVLPIVVFAALWIFW